jgi:hypothetical protein
MPLPRHFLQGTRYSNLLTIRTSGDRFEKQHWASFLFNGRLASALGEWPWTDVFMSSERSNLLLSTLSGSIVGVGDAIGEFDWDNLRRVVRGDGEIIKPDDSITPLDSTYVAVANNRSAPVVASAHTRHEGSTTTYVFAFAQANGDGQVTFSPAALGYDGRSTPTTISKDTDYTVSRTTIFRSKRPMMAPTGSLCRSGHPVWDCWATRTDSYRTGGSELHALPIWGLSRPRSSLPPAKAGSGCTDFHARDPRSARREQESRI